MTAAPRPAGARSPPQYFEFGDLEPDEVSAAGTKTWFVRSQTMCIAYSDGGRGRLASTRRGQPDEYMVLFPPGAAGVMKAGGRSEAIEGKLRGRDAARRQ